MMKVDASECSPRLLPSVPDRVETGPVQFGDDWPGLFIRGDGAANYALNLQQLVTSISQGHPVDAITLALCGDLAALLASPVQGQARAMIEAGPLSCAPVPAPEAGESRS